MPCPVRCGNTHCFSTQPPSCLFVACTLDEPSHLCSRIVNAAAEQFGQLRLRLQQAVAFGDLGFQRYHAGAFDSWHHACSPRVACGDMSLPALYCVNKVGKRPRRTGLSNIITAPSHAAWLNSQVGNSQFLRDLPCLNGKHSCCKRKLTTVTNTRQCCTTSSEKI